MHFHLLNLILLLALVALFAAPIALGVSRRRVRADRDRRLRRLWTLDLIAELDAQYRNLPVADAMAVLGSYFLPRREPTDAPAAELFVLPATEWAVPEYEVPNGRPT